MLAAELDELIADTDCERKQKELEYGSEPRNAERSVGDKETHDDSDEQAQKDEARAAAGMKSALLLDVLDGQRELVFIAENRLVLGSVILENALHIAHLRNDENVGEEDDNLEKSLGYALPEYYDLAALSDVGNGKTDEVEYPCREEEEQQNRERYTAKRSENHQNFHKLVAELFVYPFFEL